MSIDVVKEATDDDVREDVDDELLPTERNNIFSSRWFVLGTLSSRTTMLCATNELLLSHSWKSSSSSSTSSPNNKSSFSSVSSLLLLLMVLADEAHDSTRWIMLSGLRRDCDTKRICDDESRIFRLFVIVN